MTTTEKLKTIQLNLKQIASFYENVQTDECVVIVYSYHDVFE